MSKRPSADGQEAPAKKRALTKAEAAVYDRQLRVWGVEAQQRMMESKVLVVGLGGVACEICKNLILGGVGQVTLMDHEEATARDLSSNYFIAADSVGTNRAEASLANAAELNPFVKVDALVGDVATKDAEFFKPYRLVVVTNRSYAEQMAINDHCRNAGTMFVSCDIYGLCGYVFADLLDGFTYADEPGKGSAEAAQSGSSPMKTASFVSLRDAHADAWQRTREGHSRMPKLFATIAVLNCMRASSVGWEAAVATLCAENKVEQSRLDEARIKSLAPAAHSEFCPSCAIVGGVAAQEIIKFVTGRGKPMENQFYFDALDPKYPGIVHRNAGGATATKASGAPSSDQEILLL